MEKITVAKFGGTSLADASQFRKVKEIIESDPARRFIVASAPGKRCQEDIKVTDMLISCFEKAVNGEPFAELLEDVKKRFQEIIDELCIDFSIDESIEKISAHLEGTPDIDYMKSRGEYLNSQILAAYLGFTFVDPEWCVVFNEDGTLSPDLTRRTLGAALKPLNNAVIAGFYGADIKGKIRTFSRGGSDITGSIAARAIDADLYENWTDVCGLMAADPRIVSEPKTVDYLTFRELRTLSYMGASVLHTDAVLPAAKSGIPINIRNTNVPEDPGTMIVNRLPKDRDRAVITGVAGQKGMSVIQVEKVMVSNEAGFSAVLLDILKNRGIPFEQCLTGIDTVTLVIRADIFSLAKNEILSEIKELLHPDTLIVKENLSMIAVVGESQPDSVDATIKILNAVANAGIEVSTINQGAGDLNLIIGVAESKYEDAVRAIYSAIEC